MLLFSSAHCLPISVSISLLIHSKEALFFFSFSQTETRKENIISTIYSYIHPHCPTTWIFAIFDLPYCCSLVIRIDSTYLCSQLQTLQSFNFLASVSPPAVRNPLRSETMAAAATCVSWPPSPRASSCACPTGINLQPDGKTCTPGTMPGTSFEGPMK